MPNHIKFYIFMSPTDNTLKFSCKIKISHKNIWKRISLPHEISSTNTYFMPTFKCFLWVYVVHVTFPHENTMTQVWSSEGDLTLRHWIFLIIREWHLGTEFLYHTHSTLRSPFCWLNLATSMVGGLQLKNCLSLSCAACNEARSGSVLQGKGSWNY